MFLLILGLIWAWFLNKTRWIWNFFKDLAYAVWVFVCRIPFTFARFLNFLVKFFLFIVLYCFILFQIFVVVGCILMILVAIFTPIALIIFLFALLML